MKKITILTAIILLSLPSFLSAAKSWNLTGISIIKRTDWIQDESIIFKAKTTQTTSTSSEEKDDTPSTPSKTQIANTYLRQVFPEQFILDEIINKVDGKELSRSRGYKDNKTHIVIHHTVSDMSKIKNAADALTTINNIFKFHTQTRDRGDI